MDGDHVPGEMSQGMGLGIGEGGPCIIPCEKDTMHEQENVARGQHEYESCVNLAGFLEKRRAPVVVLSHTDENARGRRGTLLAR